MLTKTLITALDRAESPRAVSAAVWALEKWTGVKTQSLIEAKSNAADWYQQNGFYKLAALHGAGSNSYTGKVVNWESALDFSAMYACPKIIAEDLGTLPLHLHERDEKGTSLQKAYGNSLYHVLHDSPNPEMSSGEFREAMTVRAALGMDAYALIQRSNDGKGDVIALYPLLTQRVERTRNAYNQPVFKVTDGSGKTKEYAANEVFVLKGYTLDGYTTDDIVRRMRNAIGIGLSADEYAGRFFANDATPGVVLQFPQGISFSKEKVQEIKDAWWKWHKGASKSHEVAVLQDGGTIGRADPDHQKLQMAESRRYQIVEVARYYRMPLHKLADLDRATNNNIEHQGLEYTQHTLGPWRRRWEEAIHRCLLTAKEKRWPSGRPRMYAEFSVEAMVRGDFATQSAGFATGLQNGYYTQNEVRAMLNMNPVEGGDVPHIQLNMQTLAAAAREMVDQQTAPLKGQIKDLENKLGGMSAALRG